MPTIQRGRQTRRFAVIGAGASGLATLRVLADELRQELVSGECEIVCYEKREDSGGVWLPSKATPSPSAPPETPLYDSLTTNLPLPVMSYLTQNFPPATWLFPPHQAVNKYLHDYETRFDLRRFIKFRTLVSRASWNNQTKKWELVVQSRTRPAVQSTEHFDYLLVANGHYTKPYSPKFKGLDTWATAGSRSVIHSIWYREPSAYRGLRVLVIGGGASGNDISRDISIVASETIQSIRSGQDEQTGRVVRRGTIDRFTADGQVVFENGKRAYIDRVILATGYRYNLAFLPQLPLRLPVADSTSCYYSGWHVYPLAQHIFPLLAPFPPTSIAFIGLTRSITLFAIFEVQALLAARVMTGRANLDFDGEYQATTTRNNKLLDEFKHSPERTAEAWHDFRVLQSQFRYREHLWWLAGELDKVVPTWTRELFENALVIRGEWEDLVRRGEADSWARSIKKGTLEEWVDLSYRVLRRAQSKQARL